MGSTIDTSDEEIFIISPSPLRGPTNRRIVPSTKDRSVRCAIHPTMMTEIHCNWVP